MAWLLTLGIILTLFGVALLVWCIWTAWQVRRSDLSEAEMKARLMRVVAVNLGALALSGLGLMAVIVALVLS